MTDNFSDSPKKPGSLERIEAISRDFMEKTRIEEERLARLPKCPVCGGIMYGNQKQCSSCYHAAIWKQEAEASQKAEDVIRLGGIKAYNLFLCKTFTNKKAMSLCDGYPNKNLYLWGPTGAGKTHLATALVRLYTEGLVVKASDIYRSCRGIKSGAEEKKIIDSYVNKKFLVIDDLGVEKNTDFSMSILYSIVEARDMNYIKGLIVTSNLSPEALSEKFGDDRVMSRLAGMSKIVELTGPDGRIANKGAI